MEPTIITPVTLTAGAIPVFKLIKRRKKLEKKVGLTTNQKRFVRSIIETRGNQRAAYTMAFGNASKGASVHACNLMKRPDIQNAITQELNKHGLTRDFFLKKLKDLANASDKDGNADNRIQLDTTKIGMETAWYVKERSRQSFGQYKLQHRL
jgi:phage terminase small subunit